MRETELRRELQKRLAASSGQKTDDKKISERIQIEEARD
jgi:hypothetical protein